MWDHGRKPWEVKSGGPGSGFYKSTDEADWEKNEGGLYVSTNGGKKWSQVSGDHRLIQSAPALNSTDGGVTWSNMSGTHGDYHDLWINPKNSRNMIIADDGGAA
eukprot:gene11106-14112_t